MNITIENTPNLAPTVEELTETYDRDQLLQLRENITEALIQMDKTAKAEARDRIREIAETSGFSLVELFGGPMMTKPQQATIRYRDAAGNTWGGRGKRPQWVVDFVAAGGDLETLKIV